MTRILQRNFDARATTSIIISIILVASLGIVHHYADAATPITWDGGGDGSSFSDPLNWSSDTVPTGSDAIIIHSPEHRVVLDRDFTIESSGSITITGTGGLDLTNNYVTLNNKGEIHIINTGGVGLSLDSGDNLNNYGNLTIMNSGENSYGISSFGFINNYGLMSIENSGAASYGIYNTFIITNISGAIFISNSGSSSYGIINTGNLTVNAGKIVVANSGSSSYGIQNIAIFGISGTVDVKAGGSIKNTDSTETIPGTIRVFCGGDLNNNEGGTVIGAITYDTCTLSIASIDSSNKFIPGIWMTIRSHNGTLLKSGYGEIEFAAEAGKEYRVTVANYDGHTFDHWTDNGSTLKNRIVKVKAYSTQLLAVYNATISFGGFTPLKYAGTQTQPILTINATSLDGTKTLHMWTIIAPMTTNAIAGTTYRVYATNGYQNIVFDHWSDNGSTDRIRTITIGEPTTLTAYYRSS